MLNKTLATFLAAAALTIGTGAAQAQNCKSMTTVTVGYSVYVGWQPYYYLTQIGALKAEGAKRCLNVVSREFPTYGASLDAINAHQLDALAITNMDTLMAPVGSGIEITLLIHGDFSDGNDAVLSKDKSSVRQLKGQDIYRAQNTVTDFLIGRMLSVNGMSPRDINLVNLDDPLHVSTFESNKDVRNLGTWNPYTLQLQNYKSRDVSNVNTLFTSHQIPEEIQDWMVVTTKTLKAHPEFGDVLAAAWYKATAAMKAGDQKALGIMASTSSSTLDNYMSQLATTHLYYTPAEALEFTRSQRMKDVTTAIRDFVYSKEMMGPGKGFNNRNEFGISFPDGTVLGNPQKVMLHIDSTYMQKAASGQLK